MRAEFGVRYRAMTDGFLSFPLKFPGTAVWRAMKGRQYVIKVSARRGVTRGVAPGDARAACRLRAQRAGKGPSRLERWAGRRRAEMDS